MTMKLNQQRIHLTTPLADTTLLQLDPQLADLEFSTITLRLIHQMLIKEIPVLRLPLPKILVTFDYGDTTSTVICGPRAGAVAALDGSVVAQS